MSKLFSDDPVVQHLQTLKPTRPPDPIWDALAKEVGIVGPLTKNRRGSMNNAVKQLKEVGATPEEIALKAARYRKHYDKCVLTENALLNRWNDPKLNTTTTTASYSRVESPDASLARENKMRQELGVAPIVKLTPLEALALEKEKRDREREEWLKRRKT